MTRTLFLTTALLVASLAATATAQLPGSPLLQNAWANAGITVAGNAAAGSDGQLFAAAAAWAPSSGRFQLSGGLGYRTNEAGGDGAAFGARVTLPIYSFSGGAIGIAGFGGIGLAGEPDRIVDTLQGGNLVQLPLGVAIGYRRALGFIRGVSVYAAPFYSFSRFTAGDSTLSVGAFRISAGADIGITSRIGITVGSEFGGSSADDEPGPTGSLFGVGLSLALGRR